ncbi:MAG TPA: hypothetical protein VE869_07280 [Gemmatimonas sp.]|nr:hypothetical protein [Gemmatimonas sp.]
MRDIGARSLKALALAFALCVGVLGCDRDTTEVDNAPPELRAALAARTVYPVKREEWRTDITRHTDSTMVPQVLRASGTTVALLQASPARIAIFELNRRGLLLSTRPARIDSMLNAQVPRDLVAPTELSRVTDDGHVDIIDSARSILMRESIGGFVFRRDLPMLRGGSGRLCTVSPATLLHVRNLGARRTLEAFTITALASEDSLLGRHRFTGAPGQRLRFGTGDARRCLLLAEREIFVVSAPEAPADGVTPRIAPLRAPGSAAPSTIDDATRLRSADSTALQPIIVDAAVVDGGFVVLVGIASDRYGRLLDYYDERGEYLQSAWLPFTAAAMTGAGPRFLLLHQDERLHWWLSSWLTPMAARGAAAPPEPRQVTRAPGKQLFELASRPIKP